MIRATKSYLRGHWHFTRIIENVPAGIIGEVWGTAEFSEVDQGLACREEGVLRFQGADWHTERELLWRFPEPGRVEVRHPDGRPFHDFLTETPMSLQIDGDARYEIEYDFEPGTWTSRWEMLAPGENYRMTTRYRR